MISRYRKKISKPNLGTKSWTSFFRPFYRLIIGIRMSNNLLGQIETTITLSTTSVKIQNLCSNSSSKCVLSKTFMPRLRIPYRSKLIAEMVTKGQFPTHFQSNYGLWITCHQHIFYPKFDSEMVDLEILEKYFQAKFGNKMLRFHFNALLSTHNWIPYFGQLAGPNTNDKNSLDFHWKNTKFVFKFKFQIYTF